VELLKMLHRAVIDSRTPTEDEVSTVLQAIAKSLLEAAHQGEINARIDIEDLEYDLDLIDFAGQHQNLGGAVPGSVRTAALLDAFKIAIDKIQDEGVHTEISVPAEEDTAFCDFSWGPLTACK